MTPLTVEQLRDLLDVVNEERLKLSHEGVAAAVLLLLCDATITQLHLLQQFYEYRVLHWLGPMTKKELDHMSALSWRLIAVVPSHSRLWHYFERPCQPQSPDVRPDPDPPGSPGGPT